MAGLQHPIDRLSYLDGQTLSPEDFNESWRSDAQYRALHNLYLHRTCGIASGFDVSVSADRRDAVVQPGYAIDVLGRDVLLLQKTKVPAPLLPQPQGLLLAIAAAGNCTWWSARAWTGTEGIPLLTAWVEAGQIAGDPDFGVRQYAHSSAAPRLATGSTGARHTGWKDHTDAAVWIEATVDTSDAGFVKSPQYFAELDPPGAPLAVVSAEPQSFVVRAVGGNVTAVQAEAVGWTVRWLGIESGGEA